MGPHCIDAISKVDCRRAAQISVLLLQAGAVYSYTVEMVIDSKRHVFSHVIKAALLEGSKGSPP